MSETASPVAAAPASAAEVQERVLEVVRGLAEELGGPRAARAVAADASLEREVGLGSLERVELLLRLETAFGRALDDRFLQADTPGDVARLILEGGATGETLPARRTAALEAARAPDAAATIHESLWRRAESLPIRPHVYLRGESGVEETITYGELVSEASAVAGGLGEGGLVRGDTVALMLPTGREFLAAFQGILLAGSVPVPIYPPARLDRLEEYARRQAAILADAGVRALVTVARARGVASVLRASVPSLREVVTVDELVARGRSCPAPEGGGGDPAFIQYTSGSTGAPKGVLLTHDNLLANIRAIARGLDLRPTDVGASWLPLYHDMGLIGTWLFCLHHGIPLALQSPLAFLARPERWLWSIHEHRATLSPAPNFAYELCVRKIPDRALEGLDLSSWRVAFNGAEPVSADTIERFVARFAPFGFRREAMMPVYGLAESSVALCFPPVGRAPRVDAVARAPLESAGSARPAGHHEPALRFVSVGRALPEHEVEILDESGRPLPERRLGHLVFRGPSTMSGYYRNPEATAAVTRPEGWIDSGDLAYRAEGEVFIAGRHKDLIIKAGRNLVPQELEELAASVPGIRRGCVAAFGVAQAEQGTESLVIVAETRATEPGERDRLEAAVREKVVEAVGMPPDVVALVPPGAVPKTSSGKVRRTATREMYVAGTLGSPSGTPTAMKARLAAGAGADAMARAARGAGRALYAGYLGLLITAAALLVWLPVALVPSRRLAARLTRAGARALLRLAGCALAREGGEGLAAQGPVLFASNHASYVDVLALLALVPREFVVAAKAEVERWPLVGTLVRRSGHITVERFAVSRSVADAAKLARALEDGRSVLLFPEGTFTAAAGLRPFRLGTFKAAVETGVPVIPLALRGTRAVLRAGQRLPRPGPIHLWIGEAIAPEGEGWRAVVALRDRVADQIAAHCGEPRLDLVAGGPERR